jgi:hypothetical protein
MLEVTQLGAVINDYISRELVQDAVCDYLRSRAGGTAAQASGYG